MVTIKEVARAANVSTATVSRVYNDSDLVREATRVGVREAAHRLGYTPHAAARSLSTNRTHTIGVLLPDLYGEFFSEVIRGIDQTVRAHDYHLLLSNARHEGPSLESAIRSMRGRVDGLVVMSPDRDAGASGRSFPAHFPVVLLNCPPSATRHDSITVANYLGAGAMVRHLAGLGHRRIAIITGAERNFDAAERLRGYRAALDELGLERSRELEFAGDFTESSGHAAGLRLAGLARRPGAVFATNDCMAVGALSALREAGFRVPGDIGLGGFDDIPMARYLDPALTSVHVDISELGKRATTRLLECLREPTPEGQYREVLPATLMVRRSCGSQST